ncbi:MAG: glycosyltransferase [Chrysiogenetes bacterium]|nr:glycosyltransferase [Chrysiogenetes bacterium]
MKITTIIPTKNEEANIGPLLDSLLAYSPDEVIVVDGGSDDETREIVRAKSEQAGGVRLEVIRGGVIRQLNEAAKLASGDVLFFLHADSRLLCDPFVPIAREMASEHVAGGGFRLSYGDAKARYRFITRTANWRAGAMGLPMGDQGIFIRADVFGLLQGFREGPLLPDLDLMVRARHHGRIALVNEPLYTSPRRYEENGFLRNVLANQLLFYTHVLLSENSPEWAKKMLEKLRARERVVRS